MRKKIRDIIDFLYILALVNFRKFFGKHQNTPSLIIVGAQKAATSSLYDMLYSSNEFKKKGLKECHFFDKYNYTNSSNYYQYFSPEGIQIDATPNYIFHPLAMKRIKDFFVKVNEPPLLIFILRNPIDRLLSQYQMEIRNGFINRNLSLERVITHEQKIYQSVYDQTVNGDKNASFYHQHKCLYNRSIYSTQIQKIVDLKIHKQLLVIDFDLLIKNPKLVVEKIWLKLGLKNQKLKKVLYTNAVKSKSKRKIHISKEKIDFLNNDFNKTLEIIKSQNIEFWS